MDIRRLINRIVEESVSDDKVDYRWIYFTLKGDTGKTKMYDLFAKQGDVLLGQVKWKSSWRKYSFFPQTNTVFESDCLKDISSFLDRLMQERKG